jgi:bifunctional DNA-binding transcriptional regulator/antitoxin component of YhaV-PrlF toxin-antitoxin module
MYEGDEPSRMGDSPNGPTAPVARDGTVTIPEAVRDSLGFDGTGRVAFVETENGEVATCRVKRPAELRGATATTVDGDEEKCPSVTLREERRRDSERAVETFGHVPAEFGEDDA